MIAAWLRRHLDHRGLWDTDGISRAVRARTCRRCGQLVLVGLDAPRAGGPATVDPTSLSPLGEAAALILGRTSYALRWTGGRLELDPRSQFDIARHPAGTAGIAGIRFDVVADHACHTGPLPAIPTAHHAPRTADYSGDPPY